MAYKETLNLPKTDFSMRANLPRIEPEILSRWEAVDLYKNKILNLSFSEGEYILHDGPPYANGDIHIGHALNKILKDIVVKYMTMKGKKVVFVPGWDCHGLPVEHALFKKINKTKHDVNILKFRKKAYNYAMKYVEIQREEFKRLGVFGLWKEPYLTLKPEYETVTLEILARLVKEGFIYRGLKPVNWCSKCETALAEAEIEYELKESPSIYIKFPFRDYENTSLLVWTTTPWTLMGNVACALHPDLRYVKILVDNAENLILAEDLLSEVKAKTDLTYKIVSRFKGIDLKDGKIIHPFLSRESRVILADFVSAEEGTGIVHIAPGHGEEDYNAGLQYGLPMYVPVDDKGRFMSQYENLNSKIEEHKVYEVNSEFQGKHVFKANELIIQNLEKEGNLLFIEKLSHSYPFCWRCGSPVIFRATRQWFLSIDHKNLRKKIIEVTKGVNWFPARGETRFIDMIENRPDWCLSRQRLWGVPIPAFTCKECKQDIIDMDIVKQIAELIKNKGSDIWFEKDIQELFPQGLKCPNCSSSQLQKLEDILDVWFESGISHFAVLNPAYNLKYPAQLYLEGSDQHRGWFQTSMITAVSVLGKAPFENILTHGFVVDAEGKKMSKSRGNVVSPLDIFEEYGADILRLWVASCDYTTDVKISREILTNVAESYKKIRNTFKFFLGNLYDYSLKDIVEYSGLLDIDKWILVKTYRLLKQVDEDYKKFSFYKIYRELFEFCNNKLSSFYLDVLKDRLYIYKPDSLQRRSAQTAIFYVLTCLNKMFAPIMPFTCEQVWQYLPEVIKEKQKESVHLERFPEVKQEWFDEKLERKWEKILDIREGVLKALEIEREKGFIGSSLEAKITLHVDKKMYDFLIDFGYDLKYIFIVSQVELYESEEVEQIKDFTVQYGDMKIEVDTAEGRKCQRCWNYSQDVGKNEKYSDICQRCVDQVA